MTEAKTRELIQRLNDRKVSLRYPNDEHYFDFVRMSDIEEVVHFWRLDLNKAEKTHDLGYLYDVEKNSRDFNNRGGFNA